MSQFNCVDEDQFVQNIYTKYPHLNVLEIEVEPVLRYNIRKRLPEFNMNAV